MKNFNRRIFGLQIAGAVGTAALLLQGCGEKKNGSSTSQTGAPSSSSVNKGPEFQKLQNTLHGFSYGPQDKKYKTIVLFDPLCIHCANLWIAAEPLKNDTHWLWAPAPMLATGSMVESIAFMHSKDKKSWMDEHSKWVIENIKNSAAMQMKAKQIISPEMRASEDFKMMTDNLQALEASSSPDKNAVPQIFVLTSSKNLDIKVGGMTTEGLRMMMPAG